MRDVAQAPATVRIHRGRAEKQLRTLQAKVESGKALGDGNLTIAQLLDEWRNPVLPASMRGSL